MEELTIEQKAKAYDKAFERAKAMIKVAANQDEAIGFANTIFPELCESEDEKIRKCIGDVVREHDWSHIFGVTKDDCLAWLKKQGEQKPIMNVPSREVILSIWDLGNEWKELTNGFFSTKYGTQLDYIQKHWHESEYYLREKQGEQKPIEMKTAEESLGIDSATYNKIVDECIYGEQKPADKIEPFDKYEGLTDFERTLADICIGWIGEEIGWKQYIKDNADVLLKIAVEKFNSVQDVPFEHKPTDNDMKELLHTEYEKGRADAIAEMQKPVDCIDCTNSKGCINCKDGNMKETLVRKPAWSEEDEETLGWLCTFLNIYGHEFYEGNEENVIAWLKSLKDRYSWKPSDEQMKALHELNLTGNISYAGQGKVLIELYNDLLKLKA